MTTKIQVVYGETPVPGATVIAGEIAGEALTTNRQGRCTLPSLNEGWEGFVDIKVDTGSTIATSTMHIIEGEIHIMQLGAQST